MAGVAVDNPGLQRAHRIFEELKRKSYLPHLSQLIAVGGVKLTMDTFRAQKDPYGHAWKPLARERSRDKRARLRVERRGKKARGQKILIDTGRMKNSTTAVHEGHSGGVAIPTGYAAVHQNGGHVAPHTRLASYNNPSYRVNGLFASEKDAAKAQRRGQELKRNFFRRTYSEGITIPQRMMLPTRDAGLPDAWKRMIERETVGAIKRLVKGSHA